VLKIGVDRLFLPPPPIKLPTKAKLQLMTVVENPQATAAVFGHIPKATLSENNRNAVLARQIRVCIYGVAAVLYGPISRKRI
jgi:predicted phosphohydrolase